jgi:hypothetical protein
MERTLTLQEKVDRLLDEHSYASVLECVAHRAQSRANYFWGDPSAWKAWEGIHQTLSQTALSLRNRLNP